MKNIHSEFLFPEILILPVAIIRIISSLSLFILVFPVILKLPFIKRIPLPLILLFSERAILPSTKDVPEI